MSINIDEVTNLSELAKIKISNTFKTFSKPMYETLLEGLPTKIYLDLDFKNLECCIFNGKKNILIDFDKYFTKFLKDKNIIYDNIKYSDASRVIIENNMKKYKISYHVVVNGVGFKNRNILKNLITEFKNGLNDYLIKDAIDTSVYKVPQLFKCILSPAKDGKTILNPVLPTKELSDTEIVENINLLDYLSGIYTNNYNFIDSDFKYLDIKIDEKSKNMEKNIKSLENLSLDKKENIVPEKTINWLYKNPLICGIYRLKNKKIINNKINLIRLKPNFCKICNRIHHNENAYLIQSKNNLFFHCGRNTSNGKYIGKLYINSLKNNENTLNEIINNLKKYILELEEKVNTLTENIMYNIVKKENGKKNTKLIKKYSKNPNEGMWGKYYNLGKYINLGMKDIYENMLYHWKDKNISKLKNRSLRIYNYLNKYGNNELNLTIEKIFNFKNKDFNIIINK